jgi:hypothetical protein
MARNVEHFFMVFGLCTSSFEKYPFSSFAHFFTGY